MALHHKIIEIDTLDSLKNIRELKHGWVSDVRWSPGGETLLVASAGGLSLYINGVENKPSQIID
ncbi:MAG: hypothetical protein ACPG7F_16145, partial [Aggregatilineales bacterium]